MNFSASQRRVFLITWMAYAGFYFCRKNLSVVLPALQGSRGSRVFQAREHRIRLHPPLCRRTVCLWVAVGSHRGPGGGGRRPAPGRLLQPLHGRPQYLPLASGVRLREWSRPVDRLVRPGKDDGGLVPGSKPRRGDGVVGNELRPWRIRGHGLRHVDHHSGNDFSTTGLAARICLSGAAAAGRRGAFSRLGGGRAR